jgi:methylisocitrate lyase
MTTFTNLKTLIQKNNPVQILGVMNALCALMAEKAGAKALYLSGAGVANACFGLPDLALTGLKEVVEEVSRIKSVSKLPLLVDIDTGFGSILNIKKTALDLYRVGAGGLQIEDQPFSKRCGHLEGKKLVSSREMVARIKAIRDVLSSDQITLVARTDALGVETQEQVLERALAYQQAGADVLFLEAANNLETYQYFSEKLSIPVLANSTEFGKTPLFDFTEFKQAGVGAVLYPLSIFRVMNKAAIESYHEIIKTGSQKSILSKMQTRKELYDLIDYDKQENELDEFYKVIEQEQNHEPK